MNPLLLEVVTITAMVILAFGIAYVVTKLVMG